MHETAQILPGERAAGVGAGPVGPGVLVPVRGRAPGGLALRELGALGTFRVGAGREAGWVIPGGDAAPGASLGGPLAALEGELARGRRGELAGVGWAGVFGYGLGAVVEPRTGVKLGDLPLVELHRVGSGAGRLLESCTSGFRAGRLRSAQGRSGYIAAVGRALAYIRAGDVYQANIAHELRGRVSGSAACLYAELARGALPRHGMGYLGAPLGDGTGYAVLSMSPELFLSFDAGTRRLVTRPMKGTRPGDGDAAELRDAEKDRAELAMIVDLMRNDLGRVCEFGSVRVDVPREIERHGEGGGAVLQATATVSGVVREGVGFGEIMSATFPPGSVTGAPKVRAMQVIDELELFARGPYCGCVGTIGDDGSFELAVSIRTAVVRGPIDPKTGEFVDAEFTYCVGAGIVADSVPEAEWAETIDKARVLAPVFEIEA